MGFPSYQYTASAEFMKMDYNIYQETDGFNQRPQESEKSAFIQIWRYMGIEVKVVLLHVKIIMYQWSDMLYDELIRETDE